MSAKKSTPAPLKIDESFFILGLDGLPDLAEGLARIHEQRADDFIQQSQPQKAKVERAKAKAWRGAAALSKDEANRLADSQYQTALFRIHALLAVAQANTNQTTAERQLAMLARAAIGGLQSLAADGRTEAANAVLNTLADLVEAFEVLAKKKPDVFTPTARTLRAIPALVNAGWERGAANQDFADKLGVGTGDYLRPSPTKPPGNPTKLEEGNNAIAVDLLDSIPLAIRLHERRPYAPAPPWIAKAKRLAPLTESTWEAWWEVVVELIMHETDGKPEAHDFYYEIGKSAAKKTPKYCKELHPATQAANVQAKIFELLEAAVQRVARAK
jgi:hypothetical protein